ncbi:MAG: hypothetical protein JM58_04420 [Peptococcaceae bacterium BICA1-8]|nr:MAG: hypothetical protein JM58_04420 [Peptococcaceae bacterium BICA1-8]
MLRKGFTNGNIYSELAKELLVLTELDGAQSTCLNIIENLPSDIQLKITINLSKTNNPKLIPLFQLISREMEGEIQRIAVKTLRKFEYLGHKASPLDPLQFSFLDVQAYVSPSRLQGSCVLVFMMKMEKEYNAYYFSLAFNHLGIKEYFQHTSSNKEELLKIIEKQNLRSINYFSAQTLLQDAYKQNQRFGTKVASGLSQYKHFLTNNTKVEAKENSRELLRLSAKEVTPERLINAYFLALKNMDAALVYDIAAPSLQNKFGDRDDFLANWVHPFEKYSFIKSIPLGWINGENNASCQYQIIGSNENDELKKIDFNFDLEKNNEQWCIAGVKIECFSPINDGDPLNPLNYKVFAGVYSISNYINIKSTFDNWDKVHVTGEFDGGICYKWFKAGDPVDKGLDISSDIYGEFILTNNELIIFSSSLKNVTEICYFFQELLQDANKSVHLAVKGLCHVRDVYRVITDTEFTLAKELKEKNHIYYLSFQDYQYWHNLIRDAADERYFLGSKIQVFEIKKENALVEAIIYRNHIFIFSYGEKLEKWGKTFSVAENNIVDITSGWEQGDEKGKWHYYKLVSNLKKDPYTKFFVPQGSQLEMAKKMRILN